MQREGLQNLLAFSALREQVIGKKLSGKGLEIETGGAVAKADGIEGIQFTLDELLQLVAERAIVVTGADGVAIALAENDGIVLRATAGTVHPDVSARVDSDSAFSGASFRTLQAQNCVDTENDQRVNLQACRQLGARSIIAVPLRGSTVAIGLIEAFSARPFAFNDDDVDELGSLADVLLKALDPADQNRFAEAAEVAIQRLETIPSHAESILLAVGTHEVRQPVSTEDALAIARGLLEEYSDTTSPAIAILHEGLIEGQSSSPGDQQPVSSEAKHGATRKPSAMVRGLGGRWGFVAVPAVIIVAAIAGGIWWEVKTAPRAHSTGRPETVATEVKEVTSGQSTASGIAKPPAVHGAEPTTGTSSAMTNSRDLSKPPIVTGVEHWSAEDSSTVVLDLEDQVQYEAHRLNNPDRIYFDLHDTQLAPSLDGKSIAIGDALLNRIRIAQPAAGITRVVLETKAHPDFSVSLQPNPYRLVIEVHKVHANAPKGAVNLITNAIEAEKNKLPILVPPPRKEDLQLRTKIPKMRIVVDAGHGGRDQGTVGRNGLLEKDLVLEIAQRLGKLLDSRLGMDVIYTRQDDRYVSLDERAGIANEAQADLFISVHANYSDLPSARGVETYYTDFFMIPISKDVEGPQGESAGLGNPTPPSLTPAELQDRTEQSRRLAASVQHSMYEDLCTQNPGLRDRGIREANFVVLTESAMPGILAEVSFVSSPTDEQKLRNEGYREQVAEALYKGIARYAIGSHSVRVASAGR